jgi:hypothetical protein
VAIEGRVNSKEKAKVRIQNAELRTSGTGQSGFTFAL